MRPVVYPVILGEMERRSPPDWRLQAWSTLAEPFADLENEQLLDHYDGWFDFDGGPGRYEIKVGVKVRSVGGLGSGVVFFAGRVENIELY